MMEIVPICSLGHRHLTAHLPCGALASTVRIESNVRTESTVRTGKWQLTNYPIRG